MCSCTWKECLYCGKYIFKDVFFPIFINYIRCFCRQECVFGDSSWKAVAGVLPSIYSGWRKALTVLLWVVLAGGYQVTAVSMVFPCHSRVSVCFLRNVGGFHFFSFNIRVFGILFRLPEWFKVIYSICKPLLPEANSFSRGFISKILSE